MNIFNWIKNVRDLLPDRLKQIYSVMKISYFFTATERFFLSSKLRRFLSNSKYQHQVICPQNSSIAICLLRFNSSTVSRQSFSFFISAVWLIDGLRKFCLFLLPSLICFLNKIASILSLFSSDDTHQCRIMWGAYVTRELLIRFPIWVWRDGNFKRSSRAKTPKQEEGQKLNNPRLTIQLRALEML